MIEEMMQLFEKQGGEFVSSPSAILDKLKSIKAFIFDWDGVFNNGSKTESAGSSYSEVDSMGTNMLRFGYWLFHNQNLPFVAIITGEDNQTAIKLAERECFHHFYYNFKNKVVAFEHFMDTFGLKPEEVAFVFDDVLDIPVSKICGLKFMINRQGSPLFTEHIKKLQYCDYITGQTGGNHAVREVCELILGLSEQYEQVIQERTDFSPLYAEYLEQRKKISTRQFKFNP